MRPPVDHIFAPPFPPQLPWVNTGPLRLDQLRGRPLLVEFWDFCRPNSIRTLPYLKGWHARYAGAGLRVVGVHSAGFDASEEPAAVAAAVRRLGIGYPVVADVEHVIWRAYQNLGWPARYLFSAEQRLFDYHYGEGGYVESERAIQELLQIERRPFAPLRPEDAPDARFAPQSEDVAGAYSGAYDAGGVWGVFDGCGGVSVNGSELMIDHPGAYELVRHERDTHALLDLRVSDGVRCLATCFTPGLAV